MSDTVLVSASEGVTTVTLNRPDALNSFTNELKDTLLNIKELGEFVVNVVPERFMEQMVRTSDPLPHGCLCSPFDRGTIIVRA